MPWRATPHSKRARCLLEWVHRFQFGGIRNARRRFRVSFCCLLWRGAARTPSIAIWAASPVQRPAPPLAPRLDRAWAGRSPLAPHLEPALWSARHRQPTGQASARPLPCAQQGTEDRPVRRSPGKARRRPGTCRSRSRGTHNQTGQACKAFTHDITINGKVEQLNGIACQQPDGTWKVQP